ncbi:hypothetical protein A1D22_04405 [Pasteurellaceae bacterium LFhippo2]|nr:hypothetical protein [Pasteurellaceae bacterium LFhippo2]
MENLQLSALIEQVIQRLSQTSPVSSLGICFTGTSVNYLEALVQFQKLRADYPLNFIQSATAQAEFQRYHSIYQQTLPNATFNAELSHCSQLIFPELSFNSLAKISLGIADNVASEQCQNALLQGKKVVATLDYFAQLPIAYQQLGNSYLKGLLALGINVVPLSQLSSLFLSDNQSARLTKAVIQQEDIRPLANHQTLYIAKNSLITPAAQDWIKQKNLQLIHL